MGSVEIDNLERRSATLERRVEELERLVNLLWDKQHPKDQYWNGWMKPGAPK